MWPDVLVASIKSAIEYESVLWEKELSEGLAALRDEQLYLACLNESILELRQLRDKLMDGHTETYSTEATGVDPTNLGHHMSCLSLEGLSQESFHSRGLEGCSALRDSAVRDPVTMTSPNSLGIVEPQTDEFQDLSLGMPRSADTADCPSTIVRMTTTQLWWQYTDSHPSLAESSDDLTDDLRSKPLLQSGVHRSQEDL